MRAASVSDRFDFETNDLNMIKLSKKLQHLPANCLMVSALLISVLGCDKNEHANARKSLAVASIIEPMAEREAVKAASTESTAAASTTDTSKTATENPGSIKGKVLFVGNAQAPKQINNGNCHNNGPKPIFEESIVVNANGTLKNVVVYIKDAGVNAPPFDQEVLVDQKDCQYVPHVVGIVAGKSLNIRSSDQTLHNVHALNESNPPLNQAMSAPGTIKAQTKSAEFMKVKCDVHPWMFCYVAIMDDSFFSITADTGEFEIKNIPAGTYNLTTWHEKFGEMKQSVTVTAGKATEVDFKVTAP